MSDIHPQLENKASADPSHSRRFLRSAGLVLVLLAFLMTLYGTISYVAWQRGQTLRAEKVRTDLQEQLLKQTSLARQDIEAGNYVLALRRLDWVLEHDPDYPGARLLQGQAQNNMALMLTPLPTSTPAPPPPTAVPIIGDDAPAEELAQIQTLFDAENWPAVVERLITFRSHFPNYERFQTDRMLYDAYINLGLSLLPGTQVELGLYYLDQAEQLGDLPESVTDQRLWAELYLLGIAFYGVDWGATVFYFRDLCRAAPFFHNACDKLYESLIAYGDQYAAVEDWCPAQPIYAEARQRRSTQELSQKFSLAVEGCLAATPIPTPTVEGEERVEPEPTPDQPEP